MPQQIYVVEYFDTLDRESYVGRAYEDIDNTLKFLHKIGFTECKEKRFITTKRTFESEGHPDIAFLNVIDLYKEND